jgi:hypothetical protein
MVRVVLVRSLILLTLLVGTAVIVAQQEQRLSDDRDLVDRDLAGWDCVNRAEGTARNPDSAERNRLKNRPPVDPSQLHFDGTDTAGFLKRVADFDAQTKNKRRKDLTAPQKEQLDALEKQVVNLTAYLVVAYAGPPESTNCGNVDFHDWHLELFDKPADHAPRPGDPTPIICEITPRTLGPIYRDNVRIQQLAGFFRRTDLENEPTGHPAQKVRITGYLLWDDEHNGKADVGTAVQKIAPNKYHQPWRSTAWEIHPVLKITAADSAMSATSSPATQPLSSVTSSTSSSDTPPISNPPASTAAPQPEFVTVTKPIKIKIPYGDTIIPPGSKLPLVSHVGKTVTIKYMGAPHAIPVSATDLPQ